MPTQSVTHYYGDDHDRLDELFARFQTLKQTDLPAAVQSFEQFNTGLLQHIAWEEQILFPAFEAHTGLQSSGLTAMMRLEHRQIQSLLGVIGRELQRSKIATDGEEAQLHSVLRAHNLKEEHILYPAIDKTLSETERAEVLARMRQSSADANRDVGCDSPG